MSEDVECVFEGICHLGEGPLWSVAEQQLYWTDVFNRRLWRYDPATGRSGVAWEGAWQVGGFAFTRAGALVLCAEDRVFRLEGNDLVELERLPLQPGEQFNDVTTDPRGRLFAGTVHRRGGLGALYRIEAGTPPVRVLDGIACSNGMTFSLDERTFFHTNTGLRRVTAYDYDAATGAMSNPRVWFQGNAAQGYPDGLTLDLEDHIWQAFWGAGVVRRLSPAGAIVEERHVPARQPSSVMFGGPSLHDLYITSACQGAADLAAGLDREGRFLGGRVYRCSLPVGGRAEWPAALDESPPPSARESCAVHAGDKNT